MWERFLTWLASSYIEQASAVGARKAIEEKYKENEKIQIFSLESDIGKKVIYCSNEWEDPFFGTMKGVTFVTQAKQPMGVAVNALTGEETMLHPDGYMYADEKMVDCVLKLNPFERWNIHKRGATDHMWSKWYANGDITDGELLKSKLIEVGFI
jgi:hypothetical protein